MKGGGLRKGDGGGRKGAGLKWEKANKERKDVVWETEKEGGGRKEETEKEWREEETEKEWKEEETEKEGEWRDEETEKEGKGRDKET